MFKSCSSHANIKRSTSKKSKIKSFLLEIPRPYLSNLDVMKSTKCPNYIVVMALKS
jgi:hypothetical protein